MRSHEEIKARLIAALALPVTLAIVLLLMAPRRIAELQLTREHAALAWLMVGVALLTCVTLVVVTVVASHLASSRWVVCGAVSSAALLAGAVLSLRRLPFGPAPLLAWLVLMLVACLLVNILCMALGVLQERRALLSPGA